MVSSMRGAAALRPESPVPWDSGRKAAGIDLDLVFADMDVVAVVQGGALDTEIVHKSAVEAVEVFNDHAAGFKIVFRVIVGYGEVIDGLIVVRGVADWLRQGVHGILFYVFVGNDGG